MLAKAVAPPAQPQPVRHFHTSIGSGTRRQFLAAASVTSGVLVASSLLKPAMAFAASLAN